MITRSHMGHYFKVIQIRLEHYINRRLQELDLTSAQGLVIGFLAHAKDQPCARDIEKFFHLSHPTVSGLLSRMEAKGFVELRPDPKDRRMKRIVLLEKGMACSRQIERCIDESETLMIQGFTQEECVLFRSFLDRAIANLSEYAESCPQKREE